MTDLRPRNIVAGVKRWRIGHADPKRAGGQQQEQEQKQQLCVHLKPQTVESEDAKCIVAPNYLHTFKI